MDKMNINLLKQIINEELTHSDVRRITNSEIDDYLKSKEFETAVKKLIVDTMEKYYRMMYNKRGFWKGELR